VAAKALASLGGDLGRVRDKVIELAPAGTGEARAQAAVVRVAGSPVQLEEIVDRLEAIARRLTAIERHLGIEPHEGSAHGGGEPAAGE